MAMGREYHRKYSREYYHKRKAILINILGGKCVKCGSEEQLEFDHVGERNFKIGKLLCFPWPRVLEEIKKCQLLCNRHHREKSFAEGSYHKNRLKGSDVASAKLNEVKVSEIKKMKGTKTQQEVANIYGVCHSTIGFIWNGKFWKHVL